jgi:PST family polysaccharide transporter
LPDSQSQEQSAKKEAAPSSTPGSLTRTTVTGILWITGGRLVKTPVNLIVIAILARLLTPADFGVVAIAYTVSGLATLLVDGSFGMVLVQRREISSGVIGASLLLSCLLGAAFGGVIVAASAPLEQFFEFPELRDVLRVLGLALPVSAVAAVWMALLQRASRFGVLTINSAVAQISYGIAAVLMALGGMGMWSLVWAQVIGSSIEAFLAFLAGRRGYAVSLDREALRDVLRSGGMFTLSKFFNWGAGNVDRVVIGRLLDAAALGFYSRASTLMATAQQLIGTGAVRVLFSTFSRMQHDRERLLKAFDRALSTAIIGSTLISAFMILFADIIVHILLGDQWTAAVPLIQALFAAFVCRSGYVVAEAVPLALGLGKASAFRQAAQFVLVIAGAAIGARFGVVGATIGVAAAYWLFYLLCLALVQRLLAASFGRLLRIHLNGLLLAAFPVLAGMAARSLLAPADHLALQLLPPAIFGLVAALTLSLAPRSLLSEDIARMREQAFAVIGRRLRGGRPGN